MIKPVTSAAVGVLYIKAEPSYTSSSMAQDTIVVKAVVFDIGGVVGHLSASRPLDLKLA